MSDLSDSLTVAHLSWATWGIRSQSLICLDWSERIAQSCFLIWAKWAKLANERMSEWANERWANERIPSPAVIDLNHCSLLIRCLPPSTRWWPHTAARVMKGKKRKKQRASPDFAVERAGSKVLQKELRNVQEPNKKKLLIDGMECEGTRQKELRNEPEQDQTELWNKLEQRI